MTQLVIVLLVFLGIGIAFLGVNLLTGWLVRPNKPSPEKGQVYDCGEEPIGPAWIQFDLRFYVVALLFVIFDVEMAFFFPWAVVFGSANRATDMNLSEAEREAAARVLQPTGDLHPAGFSALSQFAFLELVVFFGILLIGFAYLWFRGDLEWVKSLAAQEKSTAKP
ncbi:MAG: NADH-quinone oxidoreductase subunit A [Fimbriiglobus sp.]